MADFETTDADAAALSSSADLKARFEAITGADGGAGDALDLHAASAKLEEMSRELDVFLEGLERDLPPDVLKSFEEKELRIAEDEAKGIRRDPAAPLLDLEARAAQATSGVAASLKEARALEAEQTKLQLDGLQASGDLEQAAKELQELRDAFDLCTGGAEDESAVAEELRRMEASKYGHEEAKADGADLDPAHRQLIEEATPGDDVEAGHMELVMNKMRYASLGVENDQLKAQIAELKEMTRRAAASKEVMPRKYSRRRSASSKCV